MNKIYSSLLVISTTLPSISLGINPKEFVSIQELHESGKISLSIIGVGGYQEECITVIIRNQSTDSIHGLIEAGRKFNSMNDGEQDILVAKNKKFSLARRQVDTIKVTGFCCEATKSSPAKNSLFGIGMLAPAAWIILTNIIDKFNFPPSAIQNAIWVLSNDHDIRSIPAFSTPETDMLRHTVADILDIELPWYSFTYAADSSNLFSGKKTHLFAEVPFNIPYRALVSAQVVDRNRNIVHDTHLGYFKAGDNMARINIPIENWEIDEYELFITEDFHTTNKKLKLTLKDLQ